MNTDHVLVMLVVAPAAWWFHIAGLNKFPKKEGCCSANKNQSKILDTNSTIHHPPSTEHPPSTMSNQLKSASKRKHQGAASPPKYYAKPVAISSDSCPNPATRINVLQEASTKRPCNLPSSIPLLHLQGAPHCPKCSPLICNVDRWWFNVRLLPQPQILSWGRPPHHLQGMLYKQQATAMTKPYTQTTDTSTSVQVFLD